MASSVKKPPAPDRATARIAALEHKVAELRQQLATASAQASNPLAFLADPQNSLENEARYHALIELSPQIIWMADPAGRVTFTNRHWHEYSGMTMEQSRGSGWTSALHPDDAEGNSRVWLDAIARGVPHMNEIRFRRNDGQYLWHLVKAAPLKSASAEVSGWIGIAIDIHERKMATAAIAEADERLRLAMEAAGMGTWDVYPELQETRWSKRSRAILGISTDDELDYQGFLARVHPADRARISASIQRAKDPQIASLYDVDYRIVRPDGTIRWVIAMGRCFFAGAGPSRKPVRFTGIMLDTTERRHAEQERAKLIAVIQHSPDLIGVAEAKGNVVFVNQSGQKLVGLHNDDEATSKNILDYLCPEEHSRFHDEILPAIRSGTVWEGTVRLRNFETGKPTALEIRGFGIFNEDGQLSSIAALGRDISEKEKLEEQLRSAQKMEAVGRLAGGIAHDFNNLLTIIKGYSEILRDHLQEDSGNLKIINEVSGAASRASSLVAQLLAFSRRQILQSRVVDLNQSILRVQGMLARLVGEDIAIELHLDSNLWRVKMDPAQVDQILINLTANARDAMPHGGKIRIETRNCDLASERHVSLSFSDNGSGMDTETLSHVFEPFFTTKETGKGTGLGLSTVYGIMQQSNGQISVTSELERGTTFTLDFPLSTEEVPVLPTVPQRRKLKGSEKILLVEDEAGVRHLLAEFMRKHGYLVHEAADAHGALKISESGSIDLLITDIVMPGANGCDLALSLARAHPQMHIIFMSGYTQHAALQEVLGQPGTSFIQKPFSLEDLLLKMRENLDQGRAKKR
ncbi:MAG: PAS domain S-box protein [Acidobacteriia bacterium]|nr:PAS domain S-box protein [Terriglobia bacterium]